jgi:hypothetical protein
MKKKRNVYLLWRTKTIIRIEVLKNSFFSLIRMEIRDLAGKFLQKKFSVNLENLLSEIQTSPEQRLL